MKISSGRGIQFFKKPVFSAPKSFVVSTFSTGKKSVTEAFANLGNLGKKKKGGK